MIKLCGVSSSKNVIVFVLLAAVIQGTYRLGITNLILPYGTHVRLFIRSENAECQKIIFVKVKCKWSRISALNAGSIETRATRLI